jgi:hypothetical protein
MTLGSWYQVVAGGTVARVTARHACRRLLLTHLVLGSIPGAPPARPRKNYGLGSERGLATPSPDGEGENLSALSSSMMTVDS